MPDHSPTLDGFRPSLIFIGCAKIWYFLPAFRNRAVLCSDGFDSVGTPKFWCWPLTILAMAGSSVLEKSLQKIISNIYSIRSQWFLFFNFQKYGIHCNALCQNKSIKSLTIFSSIIVCSWFQANIIMLDRLPPVFVFSYCNATIMPKLMLLFNSSLH